MTSDEILRSAARLIREDPSRLADLFHGLLAGAETVEACYTIQDAVMKATDRVTEATAERISDIREACQHDLERHYGEYIEVRCKKCGKSECY